ncbi:MAG: phosphorylase [Okeania sp. SIO3B3]|nr:phosphorylase [Okeania sp. SIO3B3]
MSDSNLNYDQNTLLHKTKSVTNKALDSGALKPIHTTETNIHDAGVDFHIRMVSSLTRKEKDKKEKKITNQGKDFNPFLPYEQELFVSNITGSHLALLNKFNVIDYHLLIVTRQFENQEVLLTKKDFEALWMSMADFDGLGFYNGGVVAGASQKHKHLQLIPIPQLYGSPKIPIEDLLNNVQVKNEISVCKEIPFVHSFVRFDFPPSITIDEKTIQTQKYFRVMLGEVGLNYDYQDGDIQKGSYNLLITKDWMFLVPRTEEFFHSISVNAIGFAGALLVKNDEEMKLIQELKPMKALAYRNLLMKFDIIIIEVLYD